MEDMKDFKLRGDPNRAILKDHKKDGKKLIPPLMQFPNVELVSFKDKTLPCLIWISALFVRCTDIVAAQKPVEFVKRCHGLIGQETIVQPLTFLNSFNTLNEDQKEKITSDKEIKVMADFLWGNIWHQIVLFPDHPLSFMFQSFNRDFNRDEAVSRLKEDVVGLLNRSSSHATKVQVTGVVSMIASERLIVSSHIMPDFNAIFTAPDSNEAKRAASFARSNFNTDAGYMFSEGKINQWAKYFWDQSFFLDGCIYE